MNAQPVIGRCDGTLDHGQSRRFAATQQMTVIQIGVRKLRTEQCVGVFVDLFRGLKVLLVAPVVLKLAFVGRVVPANLGASFIDSAAEVVLQVLARGMHKQIPVIVVDEDRCPVMQQIPTHKVEVSPIQRLIDGEGEIVATLRRAELAQIGVFGKFTSSTLGRGSNRGHG